MRNVINSNSVNGCGGVGIEISSSATDNTINGNRAYDCTGDGIFVDADDNQIVGNFCDGNGGDGIEIDTGVKNGLVISSNLCRDNTGYGINCDVTPTNSKVLGNVCLNNAAGDFLNCANGTLNVVAKTAAYTATMSDEVITCGAGNETFTVDLPAVVLGKIFYIKNVGTGVITVDANTTGSTTIDGDNTQTVNQYECLQVTCDASVYWAI